MNERYQKGAPSPKPMTQSICQSLGKRYTPAPIGGGFQKGMTLPELVLTIAIAGAVSALAWVYLGTTSTQAEVAIEQKNINEAVIAVQRAWGARGTYEGLSFEAVEGAKLLPTGWQDGTTEWGTVVLMEPATIQGQTNAGMALRFPGLSPEICTKMASSFTDAFWGAEVNGNSVLADGDIDPSAVIENCQQPQNEVVYVFHDGTAGSIAYANVSPESSWVRTPINPADPGTWVPAPPIDLNAPCVAPPPQTRDVGCPDGQQGASLESRSASCPSPTGAYVWTEWAAGSNTCTPLPANCPAPETRNASCPTGFQGSRMEQRDCTDGTTSPAAFGNWYIVANGCYPNPEAATPNTTPPNYGGRCVVPPTTVEEQTLTDCPSETYGHRREERYKPWFCFDEFSPAEQSPNWTDWREVENACDPCPVPQMETRTNDTPMDCPSGSYGAQTRTITEQRQGDFDCPAGTATLPFIQWSGWMETSNSVSGSCTPCPDPVTETRTVAGPPGICPVGTYGTLSSTQDETRTGTYNCPAGTETLPAISWSGWSASGPAVSSGSCSPCPASTSETETRWTMENLGCPDTWTGSRTQEREEARSRTVTTTCPAGTTFLPSPSYGAWSAWSPTGGTRGYVDTCTAPPPPPAVCTDPSASNFNGPLPCTYAPPPPAVCTDPSASNFNGPLPCTYASTPPTSTPPPAVCTDPSASNFNGPLPCTYASTPPTSTPPPAVCTDPSASNFNGPLPCTYAPPPPTANPCNSPLGNWAPGCPTAQFFGPTEDTECHELDLGPSNPSCFSGTHSLTVSPYDTVGGSSCPWACD